MLLASSERFIDTCASNAGSSRQAVITISTCRSNAGSEIERGVPARRPEKRTGTANSLKVSDETESSASCSFDSETVDRPAHAGGGARGNRDGFPRSSGSSRPSCSRGSRRCRSGCSGPGRQLRLPLRPRTQRRWRRPLPWIPTRSHRRRLSSPRHRLWFSRRLSISRRRFMSSVRFIARSTSIRASVSASPFAAFADGKPVRMIR